MGGPDEPPRTEPPSDMSLDGALLRGSLEARMFGAAPRPPTLGRFVLLSTLGRGGMGVVYKAYDPQLDRAVAVKVVSVDGADATARLLGEARALAQLNHPHVVTIHDVGEQAGQVFVAMEFVDGGTLADYCRAHPIGEPGRVARVLQLAEQAIDGLVAAHALGIVHRDVKPANLLIDSDGRLRIADFGLARASVAITDAPEGSSTSTTSPTHTNRGAGTPAYMPPEQFEGAAEARSDQFSLCATFFEALYGARPFDAPTISALLAAIEAQAVAEPASASVPEGVRQVLLRGLRADPDQRFANLGTLRTALRSAMGRRRRWRLAGGLAAVGIGVWALAVTTRPAACTDGRTRAELAVGEDVRAPIQAAIGASGVPHAEVIGAEVDRSLDQWATHWRARRLKACQQSRQADPEVARTGTRQLACLDTAADLAQQTLATLDAMTARRAGELLVTLEVLHDAARCDASALPDFDTAQGRTLAADVARGQTALAADDHDGAEAAYRRVLAQTEPGQFPRLRAQAHIDLSTTADLRGERSQARQHLVSALDEAEAADDPDLIALTWAYAAELLPPDADAATFDLLIGRAHRIVESGAASPRTHAQVLAYAAKLRIDRGQFDVAAPLIAEAIGMGEPIAHPRLAGMHWFLATVRQQQGDLAGAIAAGERAVEIQREQRGRYSRDAIAFAVNVGQLHHFAGDCATAIRHYDDAIEVFGVDGDAGAQRMANLLRSRADCHRDLERWDAARQDYDAALAANLRGREADHEQRAVILVARGNFHAIRDRHAAALRDYDAGLALMRGEGLYERAARLNAMLLRALTLASLSRHDEARAQLRIAAPWIDEVHPPPSAPHMQAIAQLSDAHAALGDTQAAQTALGRYLDAPPQGDPRWFGVLQLARAEIYLQAGDRAAALTWAQRAARALSTHGAGSIDQARAQRILDAAGGGGSETADTRPP